MTQAVGRLHPGWVVAFASIAARCKEKDVRVERIAHDRSVSSAA
jgi:hypothetical protein